jgi:hypothetical protein
MSTISPLAWAEEANRLRPKSDGLTDWFPGTNAPAHEGTYERYFTDSTICAPEASLQYWDGQLWLTAQGVPHKRQLGDYPAWRGLCQQLMAGQVITLLRGSRTRNTGPGCLRRVRATLLSASPGNLHAVLLEDDPLATARPNKTGESGTWHGLSFIDHALTDGDCAPTLEGAK